MITSIGLQQLGFKSLSFDPAGDFSLQDDGDGVGPYIKEWKSASPQPTKSEIEAAEATWQTNYDAQEYARNRQEEYPSTDDLIVALWENVIEDRTESATALETLRQAVKAKYPK